MRSFVGRLAPCIIGTSLLAPVLALATPVQAQEFGRVVGRVLHGETRAGLVGAQVAVLGTSYITVSEENGRFVLPRVPAGTHTVRAAYIGRAPVALEVTVTGGATAALEFVLGPVQLQTMIVEGVRAQGQAAALSRQQNAVNITNVVAADQMGRFPDASAPEAVQRLPGVALQRDQGEGRYIGIRGGSPANTQVTINGEQVPSPEGEVRQVALDAVPVAVLEAIEVAKAITPDMDAEAIGGSVNLVTKKAPDRPIFTAEGAGGYAAIRDGYSGVGALTWGRRTADGRLGLLVSGSYSRRSFGSDDLEPEWDIGDPGPGDDALAELQVRHYSLWRSRTGGTASLDYRINSTSTLFITGLFSELQDEEQRRRLIHVVEDDELEFQHKNRLEKLRTLNVSAGGEHTLRSGIAIDYRATVTRSEEDTPYDHEITFLQEDVPFSPDISNPLRPQPNPPAGAYSSPFLFDEFGFGQSHTRNGDYVGSFNVSMPYSFAGGRVGTLQLGVKYRDKNKRQDVTEIEYELADGPDIVLGGELGRPFSNRGYNPGNYPYPTNVTMPGEVKGFVDRFGNRLESEFLLEEETNDYEIRENTAAAYIMTELQLTPDFLLLPGVRYERTRFSADGFEWDEDTEVLSPTTGRNSYGRFFPMIHARFRVGPNTNLRAAFTTAIARPNFIDLVPYRIRDGDDLAIGNPELKPTTSRNYDLLFEHYDQAIGVMSAGVFYKQLIDPIFNFVFANNDGGETSQPQNTESGSISGLEVALQRQLNFLPAPLDGLGIYANYTYTTSRALQADGVRTRLPGQADHAWNAAMSYERRGFSGQVSLNYTGSALDELGEPGDGGVREEDLFFDRRLQVDFSASYFLLPTAQLFFEATNLTNAPYRVYQTRRIRPRQIEFYQSALLFGLRYRP